MRETQIDGVKPNSDSERDMGSDRQKAKKSDLRWEPVEQKQEKQERRTYVPDCKM